jgi:hypothetical protein
MEGAVVNTTEALKAARNAGIKLGIDENSLILEAPQAPPAAVLELLVLHKAEVLAILAAREYETEENKLVAAWAPSNAVVGESEPRLEQPCVARRSRVEEAGGVLLHFCVECGRFGPYGYGVRLRAGQLGRWYCSEHRPQEHKR